MEILCLFVCSLGAPPLQKKAFSYDLIIQIRLLVLIIYMSGKKTMMPHMWKNGYKSSSRLYNYYDIHPMAKKMFPSVSSFKSSQKLMKCWMKKKRIKTTTTCIHNTTTQFYRWVYSLWILKSLEQCKRWWSNVRMKDGK